MTQAQLAACFYATHELRMVLHFKCFFLIKDNFYISALYVIFFF